ncbi:MAG TPA: L,D-transpeptidase family protein, partial [Sphingomonas sp.]|nr:L,D-transpeptidase family protein [Sphingomonas sp.]
MAAIAAVSGLPLLERAPAPAPAAEPAKPLPPPPDPLTLAHWSADDLRQVRDVVTSVDGEGLDANDYDPDALDRLIRENATGPAADAIADRSALALAHDFALGRVTRRARFGWHIEQAPVPDALLHADLARAVRTHGVRAYLESLLPRDPRYKALRSALADTPPDAIDRRIALRASMERWRWMPRALGDDYVFVNIPAQQLTLWQGGSEGARHNVVVGKPSTPTPMLSAAIKDIDVNPWWTLPRSVLAEGKVRPGPGARARGYVFLERGGRTVIRQRPGPNNALGRLKLDMPNPYAIYLHDTPAKWAFAKEDRALSHGCIRVENITELAHAIAPENGDR